MLVSEQKRLNVLDRDATDLAEMIANKEISSREVTETFIGQIRKMNPTINFLVEDRFALALEEADYADQRIAENKAKGKLLGVPISMKESFHVSGMQTTGGLLHRKGYLQEGDAEVVQKLKAEGAIILGKTNTPELCFCQETDNKLYGRTNNPRDLTKTVGGSSGGEAAMIAVSGAAVGLGSDIGGSIRFPSHFTGVIGFKSGRGQVSASGSFPVEDHELQKRMLGIGPLTKSVKDARLIYNIVAKEQAQEKEITGFTVNILPETDYPLSSATAALMDSIYSSSNEDFKTERKAPPYFEESALLWQEIMSIDGAVGAGKEAFGEKPVRPLRAYLKELFNGKSEIHRYLSWALIGASLFKPSDKRVREIHELVERVDEELDKDLNERILIFPVYHTAAPHHGVVYKEIFSIKKTFKTYMPFVAYANVWGLPSLTIPVGMDETGMPISIQLISKNGNEDALFKLGCWIEKNYQGYVRA
ncbi:amidase [Filibacter tadaridae]|uniref:Glutamyl-tRNA(Gln) amidotransferase subunit A n=1 Tax=Filibacter tadaridae TaxID=2483811 RepID=A0A3P5XCK5_9BACL|nr:amidase [Filibacter tadaridae]VDC29072.1 Glutamyl-tRNA(Gln) amidotransferase subunit A [Filibacter tadaridae]